MKKQKGFGGLEILMCLLLIGSLTTNVLETEPSLEERKAIYMEQCNEMAGMSKEHCSENMNLVFRVNK